MVVLVSVVVMYGEWKASGIDGDGDSEGLRNYEMVRMIVTEINNIGNRPLP